MAHSFQSQRTSRRRRWPWLLLLPILCWLALGLWRTGPAPQLTLTPDLPGIGPSTSIDVTANEPTRGLSDLRLTLVQGEREDTLLHETFDPRPYWAFWGDHTATFQSRVDVGRDTLPELQEGEATLRWTARRAGTWLRQPEPVVEELTLPVRLTPPTLQVMSQSPIIVDQGGAAVVVYQVGEGAERDGVVWDDHVFPGSPLPGGNGAQRFAFFGAPHDATSADGARLEVVDALGNRRAVPFIETYRQRAMTFDQINLSDGFMQKVGDEIYAQTPRLQRPDDLLEGYLQLNRDLRRDNSRRLQELAQESVPEFLWRGAFEQLPNSRVMAPFADRRTYRLRGEDVDQQDHLGYDLASVRQAPVPAANAGRVVLAEYFGIYGNTVVLDHGYGLMSLYSHLSSLQVEPGQAVAQGDVLGRTGKTGLAGGDHLHYSMLIWGLQVSPLEWWDGRWIERRITDSLGDAWPRD